MIYPTPPTYLKGVCAPGSYLDTRTSQLVWYTPDQVSQLYQQEQVGLQQQEQHRLQQPQQFDFGTSQYFPQYQDQAQPVVNYGHLNIGSINIGSHQSGYGNHNFGNQHIGYQQQAPFLSQQNVQNNLGGYNAAPAPVQYVQAHAPGASPSGPIDLTDDTAADESVAASQSTVSGIVRAAPALSPKPDPTTWKNGREYLIKMLNNAGWTNRWFLFASMKDVPALKRNSYCAAHWPTKEAAYEDIVEMSQYFIDAAEMIAYRASWDHIEADLASAHLNEKEKDKTRKNLDSEKRRLQSELSDKKQIKLNRIEAARDGQYIDGMRRPEFQRKFEQKSIFVNKQKLKAKREAERDAELEKERASKKSRTGANPKAGGVQSSEPKPRSKRRKRAKAAPMISQVLGIDQDAEGETDDEVPAAATTAPLPPANLKALDAEYRTPSPEPWTEPGSADLEIIENPETSLRVVNTAQSTESLPEQVTAPISPVTLASREETTVTEDKAERRDSLSPESDELSEHATAPVEEAAASQPEPEWELTEDFMLEELQEQVTGPSPPINESRKENTVAQGPSYHNSLSSLSENPVEQATAHIGWASPSLPSEELSPFAKTLFKEQATAPPPPPKAPQPRWDVNGNILSAEEFPAMHSDEGYDSLFEDDGEME